MTPPPHTPMHTHPSTRPAWLGNGVFPLTPMQGLLLGGGGGESPTSVTQHLAPSPRQTRSRLPGQRSPLAGGEPPPLSPSDRQVGVAEEESLQQLPGLAASPCQGGGGAHA